MGSFDKDRLILNKLLGSQNQAAGRRIGKSEDGDSEGVYVRVVEHARVEEIEDIHPSLEPSTFPLGKPLLQVSIVVEETSRNSLTCAAPYTIPMRLID